MRSLQWQLPSLLAFIILVLFLLTYILSSPSPICKDQDQ